MCCVAFWCGVVCVCVEMVVRVCVCCGVCGVFFVCVCTYGVGCWCCVCTCGVVCCVYMWCVVLVLCVYMWCCVLCGLCLCVRVVWWCVWCGVVCGEAWHAENSPVCTFKTPPCVRSGRLRVYQRVEAVAVYLRQHSAGTTNSRISLAALLLQCGCGPST